jgi:tRNA(Ile)-lysidine synthase
VATFDHATGPAAMAAAAHVARTAAALGLPVVSGRISHNERPVAGREAAWRRARYAFLRAAAEPFGARIVTAHTEDDQVETVLMRVLRGSGTRGLAGLATPSAVVRPFLALRRSSIRDFAQTRGVRWREDPSNGSHAFLRNRVRRDLLPALRRADPSIDESLLAVARRAADWRADVEAFVDEHLGATVSSAGAVTVARSELAVHGADSLAVLWTALAGRVGLALDRRGTRRLAPFTTSGRRRGSMPLSGGWRVEVSGDCFVLRRPPSVAAAAAPLPREGSLRWGAFRFRASDDMLAKDGMATRRAWSATLPADSALVVRPWMAGDRLGPASGQQRRRVKRYLTEAGIRGLDRPGWPVVVANDDVVWIPGVRRSDAATERSGRPVLTYVCERLDR